MSAKTSEILAILGSGPAGLMAASQAALRGARVRIYEKRKGPGRKLLIAGSSGLNITYEEAGARMEFAAHYGDSSERIEGALRDFSPADWREFIERELGIPTFKGTSRRWFVHTEGMKASSLLKGWTAWLEARGVEFVYGRECVGFDAQHDNHAVEGRTTSGVRLHFADGSSEQVAAACLCFGGGSWEPTEQPLRWPAWLQARQGLGFSEFVSSNVGFNVAWPEALLAEADGKPIKNVVLASSRGSRAGDLVITRYGIEGTPVYTCGETETVHLDLKPDLSLEALREKLALVRENLSPIRRVKRYLGLGEGALALVFHCTPKEVLDDLAALVARLKAFPLAFGARQPLTEAISSSGGLHWDELDADLMLRRYPGVFAAGEMIDWDAPTGGFLIQACVSQGAFAGRRMSEWVKARSE